MLAAVSSSSRGTALADESERAGAFTAEVIAPLPGKILDVLVAASDEIAHHEPLVRLQAMRMAQRIHAPAPLILDRADA